MRVRNIGLAILAITLWVDVAFAATIQITSRSGVNVRNSNNTVIGTLPKGATAEFVRVEGKYTYIKFNGRNARVYTKFTKTVDGPADEWKTVDTSAPVEEEPAPKPKPKPKPKPVEADDDDDDNGGGSTFDTSIKYSCSNGVKKCTSGKNKKCYNVKKADSGTCGDITVNCSTHMISFSGVRVPASDRVINCGKKGTTKDGVGTIGGIHNGRRVPNGVQINGIRGMGASGGGRVFHSPWWNGNMKPTGLNSSRGCIHVAPSVLALLKRCKGSKLTIKNSYGGKNNSSGRDTDEGEAQGNY